MMKRIAFIGGVHGVGKTVFCEILSSSIEFAHVTASNLINKRQQIVPKNKYESNIEKNQIFLLQELSVMSG